MICLFSGEKLRKFRLRENGDALTEFKIQIEEIYDPLNGFVDFSIISIKIRTRWEPDI